MKLVKFVAIALLGIALIACGGGNKPENVAKKFIEYGYKGDADNMLKLINIPENAKKDGTQEIVSGKLKQAAIKSKEESDRKGGLKEVVVESSQIDEPNGTGRVKIVVHFKNDGSKSQTENVRVIRSGKEWKVNL